MPQFWPQVMVWVDGKLIGRFRPQHVRLPLGTRFSEDYGDWPTTLALSPEAVCRAGQWEALGGRQVQVYLVWPPDLRAEKGGKP